MKLEWIILVIVWAIGIALIFIIPKNKRRLALVAFLFKQVITLLFGSVVVQFDLIAYPIRLFADVNRASFSYEFFLYPIVCAVFNVFYPVSKSILYRLGFFTVFCSALTITEIFLVQYTDLIDYLQWSWYLTWITLFLTFLLSRKFFIWFFNNTFIQDRNANDE
ncbi:CBO0543 family protein [Paraliobacillus zengyii]|uniref:CBO0543 family protein n=1 Tax=Paraliobacillus zengyii TaxID=2213194 RepID=UPI000DD4E845|nr:CBO0543 family protein [Paraliobacillus zengyii]